MTVRKVRSVTIVSLLTACLSAYAQEDIDPMIGHTSTNQLRAEFDFGTPIALPPVNSLLHGWAVNDPGFIHLDADDPNKDIFTLGDGASVRFDVVSFAPAFKAWTPGFGAILHDPGDSYLFPDGNQLHTHFTWHIDSLDPLFDPAAGPWTASFRFVDVGTTGYSPSDVYTFTFTPEPSSFVLLGLVGLTALRRRVG